MFVPPYLIELVRDLAVLRAVEPKSLLGLLDPHSDGQIDDLDDHEGGDRGVDPGRADRDDLLQELLGIAVEEPVGARAVDRDGGEDPGRERAPGPADAV